MPTNTKCSINLPRSNVFDSENVLLYTVIALWLFKLSNSIAVMNGRVIIIHIEFIHIGIGHVWNIVFLDSVALCNFIVFSQQIPTQINECKVHRTRNEHVNIDGLDSKMLGRCHSFSIESQTFLFDYEMCDEFVDDARTKKK